MRRERLAREGWLAGSVMAAALGIRLLHLQQIRANDPYFTLPPVDPAVYHAWAIELAEGNWIGSRVFFQSPLYPYFLALLYRVFGSGFGVGPLAQALLGAGACGLVYALGRRLYDWRVGLVAGLLTAFYSMLVFFGGMLLLENLQIPLLLGLLLAFVGALEAPSRARFLGVGALIGLCALSRANLLLYAPFAVAWLVYALRNRAPLRARLGFASLLLAGLALVVFPVTLRNWAVSGDLVLINSQGGANFYTGNHPAADGSWNVPPLFPRTLADDPLQQEEAFRLYAEHELGRALRPSEVSGYWWSQGLAFAREDPAAWLRLLVRKLGLFLNRHEIWNNRSYAFAAPFSWVLRLPLVGFGLLAPLAALGVALTLSDWRRLAPLHAAIAVYALTALLFFVVSRYRVPAVPLLAVLAGAGVVRGFEALRAKDARRLAPALAAAALVALVARLDLTHDDFSIEHYNLANKYKELGQSELAIEHYTRALEQNPSYVSAWNNLALVYERSEGRSDEAIRGWEAVLALGQRMNSDLYVERAARHLQALRGGAGGDVPD